MKKTDTKDYMLYDLTYISRKVTSMRDSKSGVT